MYVIFFRSLAISGVPGKVKMSPLSARSRAELLTEEPLAVMTKDGAAIDRIDACLWKDRRGSIYYILYAYSLLIYTSGATENRR